MDTNKVLIVGIDPYLIDFNAPEYAAFPGLTAEKIEATLKGAVATLSEKGFEADVCWTDFGQTAAEILQKKLNAHKYTCVMVAAGIRVPAANFQLFETLVNVVHDNAPGASICFNTNPGDTIAAIERWCNN